MPAKLATPPTTAAEVRSLMALEVVKSSPDKDRLRFLGELLVSFEGVEARRETAASALLPAITAERDALLSRVNELQPLADRLPGLEAELSDIKSNNTEWRAEQVRVLTADAQRKLWGAERTERAVKEKLESAQSRFGQAGLQLLLDEVKKLITQHDISEPDAVSLPAGISSMFLTLWGHTPAFASVALSYAQSYREPNEEFKRQLFRILVAGLPTYDGALPETISDLDERRIVLCAMAARWQALESVQRQVDQIQAQRHGEFLLRQGIMLQAQQSDLAVQGYGRDPIRVEESASSVPTSEHLIGCECLVCSGGIRRRTSLDAIEEIA